MSRKSQSQNETSGDLCFDSSLQPPGGKNIHLSSLFVIKQNIIDFKWPRRGCNNKVIRLFQSQNLHLFASADLLWSWAEWKAGIMYSRFIKTEPPRGPKYSIVCWTALLFKPKDIQYSVYPTGTLHKDPFLVEFLRLDKCLLFMCRLAKQTD